MRNCEANHFQFNSSDGLPIAGVRWDDGRSNRGVVQMAHSLGEHIGRHTGPVDFLACVSAATFCQVVERHSLDLALFVVGVSLFLAMKVIEGRDLLFFRLSVSNARVPGMNGATKITINQL
jgi:hypothetical protein